MNFFTYIFQGFWLDLKLLFIVLFLGIISWRGVSCFNGGICFSDGRASFLSLGMPHRGASVLMGGFSKKIAGWGGTPAPRCYGKPYMWPLFGSVQVYITLYFLPLWICNFPSSLFNKRPFLITAYYKILLILILNLFLSLSVFFVFLNEYFF